VETFAPALKQINNLPGFTWPVEKDGLGRQLAAIVRAGGVSWEVERQRGLPIS